MQNTNKIKEVMKMAKKNLEKIVRHVSNRGGDVQSRKYVYRLFCGGVYRCLKSLFRANNPEWVYVGY